MKKLKFGRKLLKLIATQFHASENIAFGIKRAFEEKK